ncbi:molybdopterin-dependent oxidoreductase [Acetobacterium sp.]|jgi:DMSO/TMAO reductase YedYZ molybdopterin-dependent catalytic subunit|uniref:molybdopterin-dependent oxidoreductase n=1 Tax=Acetobacterium sp. TaxID=1872094 RepID=UPI000CBD57BA|nr:molybdopterin-dependent oxidoreductase [Acetobacterium sp.]MDO9492577.1 molybdopterin-dependent oxidoreductase [Acetobacterium sp.]PKM73670.1 MAG: oxidoreductase [Firmicutes bacterium HGW-Firmicutes-17]
MRRIIILVVAVIAVGITVYLVSTMNLFSENNNNKQDAVSQATASRYQELEIREYQGVQLDPAIGPRDNSISGIQAVDLNSYQLQLTGLVENPISYSYQQVLAKEPAQRLITLYCVEGWQATVLWEGVRITDLLADAGIKDDATIVIFHCVDGYTTSIPLATIKDKDMLLAYSANDLPLPASMGFPFIVVAEDKLGYKWARWVNEIELSSDESYEGYWEKRGYSNDATVN